MMTEHINSFDVLLGRGGQSNNNSGNIRFREVVASKQMIYLNAKKKEKKEIAMECVATVQSNGGRFLRRDDASGTWVEVPKGKAVMKASQALREGLDVRHKKIREGKVMKSDGNSQKRSKVLTGKVSGTSPALVSIQGGEGHVPDLNEEASQAPAAVSFKYQPSAISKGDCEHVTEV